MVGGFYFLDKLVVKLWSTVRRRVLHLSPSPSYQAVATVEFPYVGEVKATIAGLFVWFAIWLLNGADMFQLLPDSDVDAFWKVNEKEKTLKENWKHFIAGETKQYVITTETVAGVMQRAVELSGSWGCHHFSKSRIQFKFWIQGQENDVNTDSVHIWILKYQQIIYTWKLSFIFYFLSLKRTPAWLSHGCRS